MRICVVQKFSISKLRGRQFQTALFKGVVTMAAMDARRQQALGLAVIALLILLFVLLRRYWSGA